jgi:peptidoglycan/xylan/chitin deacetylase (PgdA/CDA1 family)
MYHRVGDLPSDPFQLAVSPRHFAEHMEILRLHFCPTRLLELAARLRGEGPPRRFIGVRELAGAVRGQNIPSRTVAVTFDDGYQDNLTSAKPLMERWEVPGTVFVASGYVGRGREFWWDELERLLLTPGTLPEKVTLETNGDAFAWDLGPAARYTQADYESGRHWHGLLGGQPGPRQRLFLALHQRLRPLPERDQRRVLDRLRDWTGLTETRPTHRTLSREELCRLDEGGLVEIGAHTVTHPVLSAHPPSVQREEILRSKKDLEQVLGHPVTSFAYPYGTVDDYTGDTLAVLSEGGFTTACTTTAGLVSRADDRFRLRRIVVRDVDGNAFARLLRDAFHG